MRRAILGITGLAASTTLLVVLKGGPATTATAQDVPVGPAGASTDPSAGAPPEPTPDPAGGGPVPTVSGAAPGAPSGSPGRSKTPSGRPTSKAPTGGGATTTKAPPPPSGPRKIDGSVATAADFGLVQVQITVSGDRITNVTALELPGETATSSGKSDQVDRAYSGTGGQAVTAANQGRLPDTISGATATSSAYRRSLQAALDRM
ncbi:FMN-binding protein [Micromonospora sp. NBC_01699]|uniref:FMN-binding protein n=1 Tax=Micromonospora sp. NBC_01699 TaxID=2975984 RepID=UPI002E2B821D|nr:FMN-binding protein [Micromonospora sp. NBC_01699]